jgi:hypothetical protein
VRGLSLRVRRGALLEDGGTLEHAKAVLLVDYGEEEAAVGDPGGEEGVRPDDEVDPSRGEFLKQARPPLGLDVPVRKATRIPIGSSRAAAFSACWRARTRSARAGDLPAKVDGAAGREEGDEGLSRPDVALKEAGHPFRRREVLVHRGDGDQLVRRQLEGQSLDEAGLQRGEAELGGR